MKQQTRSIVLAHQLVLALGVCGFISGSAIADWPSDPSSPLVVGTMENAFGAQQSVAASDNGAVWYAWQDSLCVGLVRAQRVGFDGTVLGNNGFEVQEDPTCAFHLPPTLLPIGDGVVVSRALSSVRDFPVQRFMSDGSVQWVDGFSVNSPNSLGSVAELTNGDVLIVTHAFGEIYADRINASGAAVWPQQSVVVDGISSNLRILSALPHPDGGAYVFWDSPLTYKRLILGMRINADGSRAWDEPTRMVTPPPGVASSRHTTPVVTDDGAGGATLLFTEGFETGTTPAPLLLQRINPDGSLSFHLDGTRVSLGTNRQYFPNVQTNPATGDLFIVWMDGQSTNAEVRAQRMTLTGDRLWGEEGIAIAPFDFTFGSFDAVWMNNQLSVIVGGNGIVELNRIDALGNATTNPIVVGTTGITEYVRSVASGDGIVVSWQADQSIVAQRVNPDGRLGNASCNKVDFNGDGQIDFFDISAFITAFSNQQPEADFTADGVFDFFDIAAFLSAFTAGCP